MEKELKILKVLEQKRVGKDTTVTNVTEEAYKELEQGIYMALETYSNVHRGSGHYSMVTTSLFEQARGIVLEYLGLDKAHYVVIFCTPRRALTLSRQLVPDSYEMVSSVDIGLSLGVRALAVKKEALPKNRPFETGGGSARLISQEWVVWGAAPDKFEAGTPAVINIIAFAKALQMIRKNGKYIFLESTPAKMTAEELLYHDELEKYSGTELLNQLRKVQIGKNVKVPTIEGDRSFINLDNSASTPSFIPIWDAFRKTWRQSDQSKTEIVQEVKSICANELDAPLDDYDMIFTSNTTEAINLAAESMGREAEEGFMPIVLSTLFEHSSNDLPWRYLPHSSMIRLYPDAEGFVDLQELEKLLKAYNEKCQYGNKRIRLLAISGASNVLGTCNHLASISSVVHRYGVQLLVDAAQLVAHRKIDIEGCGIDYLAFSAHKVYAPFGSGMLIARKGLLNFNFAEKEVICSSGEENAGGIAAMGKALLLLNRIGMDVIQEEEQALTRRTLNGMAGISGLSVYGIKDVNSPAFANKLGVIVFGLKASQSPRVADKLAMQGGIGVRSGCHCAHMIIKHLLHIPPPLEHFQRTILKFFPKLSLPGLVRVSFGIENSMEDIDILIYELRKIARQPLPLKDSPAAAIQRGMPIFSKKEVQLQMADFVHDSSQKVYFQQ